jgi:hypothetical protein
MVARNLTVKGHGKNAHCSVPNCMVLPTCLSILVQPPLGDYLFILS